MSETRKEFNELSGFRLYPTIHYFDDKYVKGLADPIAIVEHILDPDIKSLSINISFGWSEKNQKFPVKTSRLLRAVKAEIDSFAKIVIPDDVEYKVDVLFELLSICISVPDFTACPLFQTEKLAEMALERILNMITVCGKCRFIVESTTGLCPECGAELLRFEEIVAEGESVDKKRTDK